MDCYIHLNKSKKKPNLAGITGKYQIEPGIAIDTTHPDIFLKDFVDGAEYTFGADLKSINLPKGVANHPMGQREERITTYPNLGAALTLTKALNNSSNGYKRDLLFVVKEFDDSEKGIKKFRESLSRIFPNQNIGKVVLLN
jgi:hypothetical protein